MHRIRASLMALATLLAGACGSDGGGSTSPATPSAAAAAFIDAWAASDTAQMGRLGRPEAVDAALARGRAGGRGDCSTQPNGQYQCIVGVSSGGRMYLLVGAPGASDVQVWWVAEYVPGT